MDSIIKLPINSILLDSLSTRTEIIEEKEDAHKTPEIFFLFGKETPIAKKDIFSKDTLTQRIFANILENEHNLHLGSFWFPKDDQQIPLVSHTYRECKELIDVNKPPKGTDISEKSWKVLNSNRGDCGIESFVIRKLGFDNIKISLYEGSLVDIKVTLKDSSGNFYLFENKLSVSLLFFQKTSQRTFLKNALQRTHDKEGNDYSRFKLRLSEVLRYVSEPGGNFVPDDQNFTFPKRSGASNTNNKSTNVYELYQTTSLHNVIDLRTYTDAQSLFGNSASGIAQFEGNASFFANPYTLKGTPLFLFKKVRPYVNYARFDEDNRSLDIIQEGMETKLANRLDHLQKTFLDLGVRTDIVSFILR